MKEAWWNRGWNGDIWSLRYSLCVMCPHSLGLLTHLFPSPNSLTPATQPNNVRYREHTNFHLRVIVSTWNEHSSPRQPWFTSLFLYLLQNFAPGMLSQWGLQGPPFLKVHTLHSPFPSPTPSFPSMNDIKLPQGWCTYYTHSLSPCTRMWAPGGRDYYLFCFDA